MNLFRHNISDFVTNACRFSHVFWIDASSEDTIALGLRGLCAYPDAKAAGISVSSTSALIWIASLQGKWLLVFDNADGAPEVVEKVIPSGSQGNILVTSRNRSLGRVTSYDNTLEVDQMAEKEAISLLVKASHLTELPEHVYSIAQQIVNELCCLPLAVDQAGASIEAGLCIITNYLEHLSQHRKKLMNHPSFRGASQYNRTVYETWDLSLNEIESRADDKSDGHGRAAAQAAILILETAAFLHHENIIEAAFRKAAMEFSKGQHSKLEENVKCCLTQLLHLENNQSWNQFFFHEGIRVLISFSLIKRGSTSGIYAIHPLMHQWSRDRMSMSQKRCMMQVAKLILVNSITREMTAENIAFNRVLVPHIKANQCSERENGFKIMFDDNEYSKFSYVFHQNGMWKDAEDVNYQLVEMRMKELGMEHPSTLTSMANLAVTYSHQGKYEEAGELKLKVLNLRNRILGPEHPQTLTSMNNLAVTYSRQGKYEEAGELQLKVLNLRNTVLGPEHPDTLISMGNLAGTYSNQGKYDEAVELELKVLDLSKKVLGPDHPYTLTGMMILAVTYSGQAKYKESEALLLKVLDLSKKVLGPEHPHTLTSMANLANTYSHQEKYEEAEELELKVLDLSEKVLGPEHPDRLSSMIHLAITYSDQGKYEEAEKLKLQVLALHNKVLGPEHPQTLISMGNLAVTYLHQGKYEEAEELELKLLDFCKKVLGSEHLDILTSMKNLAVTYADQGKYEEAEKLRLKVLDLHKKVLGPEHPDTLSRIENLVSTYFYQEDMRRVRYCS